MHEHCFYGMQLLQFMSTILYNLTIGPLSFWFVEVNASITKVTYMGMIIINTVEQTFNSPQLR